MKKRLLIIATVVAVILIGVVDIYFHKQNQRQMLVSPEYPLKKEVVAKALEDCDVSCVIEEHSPTEQSLSFSLRDEETNFLYAGIKTQKIEEERMLGIIFFSFDSETEISEEECKNAIIMGTCLFGGFEDEEQVYNQFVKDFQPKESLLWQKKIEGIDCEVEFQLMPEQQRYVMKIGFID